MDLVVMAAGMGSRFGGLKQIQPVDEDKNFIIDYSVYDAIRAGFDRVIFIIKEENYELFKSTIGNRLAGVIPVEYAFQKQDDVPVGVEIPKDRTKPWGTSHAIYAVRDIVDEKFAVINADDFYGKESFQTMADCLKNGKPYEFYSAGFQVKNTLSDKGAVKRGIFYEDEKCGVRLVESHVERRADGNVYATALNENDWHIVDENTQVSMNMFGFPKSKLMSMLREGRARFFAQPQEVLASSKVEWLIPDDVDKAVNRGDATLKVVETPSKWYGITYKEDLEEFIQAIRSMKMAGEYPEHLYENQIEM